MFRDQSVQLAFKLIECTKMSHTNLVVAPGVSIAAPAK